MSDGKVEQHKVQLAMYAGPADDFVHVVTHWGIRFYFLNTYSHAELVVDGISYSSSARDGGVRGKAIDLDSGKWHLYDLPGVDADFALQWFKDHAGCGYDWAGVAAYPIPGLHHDANRFFCFEAVALALKLPKAENMTPRTLVEYAFQQQVLHYGRPSNA